MQETCLSLLDQSVLITVTLCPFSVHRRLLCCFTYLNRRNPLAILVRDLWKRTPDPSSSTHGEPCSPCFRHYHVMQAALRCAPLQTTAADRDHSALLLSRERFIGQI